MNMTYAFVERMAEMTPYDRGMFLQKNKTDIDFRTVISKAKELIVGIELKRSGEIKWSKQEADNLTRAKDKMEDIIEDSVFYAAAQQYPSAVEGPYIQSRTGLSVFHAAEE